MCSNYNSKYVTHNPKTVLREGWGEDRKRETYGRKREGGSKREKGADGF